MLDEPSAGLAPAIVEEVFGEIASLTKEGLCVLLVEQLIDHSLAVADRVAVLDHGRITIDTEVSKLGSWDALRESYLGGAGGEVTMWTTDVTWKRRHCAGRRARDELPRGG